MTGSRIERRAWQWANLAMGVYFATLAAYTLHYGVSLGVSAGTWVGMAAGYVFLLVGTALLAASPLGSLTAVRARVVGLSVAAGVAALLAAAMLSLRRGQSGMRGVAVFVELMLLPLGYYLAQAGLWWFAVPAWILGVGTIAALLAPATRESVGVR